MSRAQTRADDDAAASRYAVRLGLCVALSFGAHLGFQHGLESLPAQVTAAPVRRVTVALVAPPTAPPAPVTEPPPAPVTEPPPPAPKVPPKVTEVVTHLAKARPEPAMPRPTPLDAPPTERPDPNADPDAEPVFGVSMASTTTAGNGAAFPTGNTLAGRPGARAPSSQAARPLVGGGGGEAAPAWEVTKMPLPRGRCAGKYTDAARAAGLEGTVVLELTVGADGRATDIRIVTGLGGGLSEAAVEALRACRFTPGERNGEAVAVRIRAFKVSFALREAE